MTEQSWTVDELDHIGDADELHIAPRRKDGTLRPAVPIWVVRVGDELHVRSWLSDGGRWYRAARASGEGQVSAGGMAGVAPQDAGVAGGLVNVAHHLGGALGLGILVTVFDAAGAASDEPHELLAHRVSAALTAPAFLMLALLVMVMACPRRAAATRSVDDARLAAAADTPVRAPA
jgi:hypothetical protein